MYVTVITGLLHVHDSDYRVITLRDSDYRVITGMWQARRR